MRVNGKMEAVNEAIRAAVPHMQVVARQNPQAAIFVNTIRFGDEARWLVERLTPLSEFLWQDIQAEGVTALGEALTMVGQALQPPLIRGYALPPILVLITDGLPTDDFRVGLEHLLAQPWGRQAMRLVISVGEDGASPEAQEMFRAFISGNGARPLQANNPDTLSRQILWLSTTALQVICAPLLRNESPGGEPGPAFPFPAGFASLDEADIW